MPELLTISLQFTSLLGKTIHFSKIIITSLGQSESKHLCLYSIWLFPHMLTVASGAEQQGESKATIQSHCADNSNLGWQASCSKRTTNINIYNLYFSCLKSTMDLSYLSLGYSCVVHRYQFKNKKV